MTSARVMLVGAFTPTSGGIANVLAGHLAGLRSRGALVSTIDTGDIARSRPNAVSLANVTAVVRDAWRVAAAVRRERPDLVAVHTTGVPLLPILRAGALVLGVVLGRAPYVLHLHSDLGGVPVSRPQRVALGTLLRRAATVVVLTESDATIVREVEPRVESVRIVPNGVDVTVFTPGAKALGSPRVVYLGAIAERKGLFDLLDALVLIDEAFALDVVGAPGPEGAEVGVRFERAVASSAIAERVVLHGELGPSDVRRILRAASIFVLPSHMEGVSVALLEAMACGLPTVVSDVGGTGGVVDAAKCGAVVAPHDPVALRGALRLLLSDASLRQSLGESARSAALEHHNLSTTLDVLAAVYENAAGVRP